MIVKLQLPMDETASALLYSEDHRIELLVPVVNLPEPLRNGPNKRFLYIAIKGPPSDATLVFHGDAPEQEW